MEVHHREWPPPLARCASLDQSAAVAVQTGTRRHGHVEAEGARHGSVDEGCSPACSLAGGFSPIKKHLERRSGRGAIRSDWPQLRHAAGRSCGMKLLAAESACSWPQLRHAAAGRRIGMQLAHGCEAPCRVRMSACPTRGPRDVGVPDTWATPCKDVGVPDTWATGCRRARHVGHALGAW